MRVTFSGRAQKMTVEKIIGMLEDDDRLVRESGCLALGYLKAGGKSELAVADRWYVFSTQSSNNFLSFFVPSN